MSLILAKAVYILGITNLIFLILVLFSCRCFLGTKAYIVLMGKAWFKKFYRYHCFYWWGFVISVFLHAALAFLAFGNPFF